MHTQIRVAFKGQTCSHYPFAATRHGRCGSWNGVWAMHTGQDFLSNNAPAAIDFASFHLWPDNWVCTGANGTCTPLML
jgi:hypothetical protein